MRFYEGGRALPRLQAALNGKEADEPALRRSAFALQDVAEFAPATRAQAADYLRQVLLSLPAVPDAVALLCDTLVTLAPAGRFEALAARLAADLQQAEQHELRGESEMMACDKLRAMLRNTLPPARALALSKAAIEVLPESQRIEPMVRSYLGLADAGGWLLEELFGRQLRALALAGMQADVLAAFTAQVERVLRHADPAVQTDFVVSRAIQAIVYLGGEPVPAHLDYAAREPMPTAHFLWDDPA